MEYRVNRRTGDRISVLGVGTSGLPAAGAKEGAATLEMALEQGINYFDLATADSACFPIFGAALAGVRRQVLYQVHFGANYAAGKPYSWTTDLETVKRSVAWQLEQLRTDYIDYGFIHCMDESGDWRRYVDNGVLQFLEALKAQGVVRHIGLSTHTPALAREVLDTGLADMMMFSINPSYDYQHGEYANGSATERMALYRLCEAEGVGISVMKPFFAGRLLSADQSPFGTALTHSQCLQYAIDRPGVLVAVPGVQTMAHLDQLLKFLTATDEEKDYSVIGSFTADTISGTCVYCNHCQPCPAGIDIGLVNKYYDLALAGDAIAANHYTKLSVNADACLHCGHCESRCPFGVKQESRMEEIARYFG